MKRVVHIIASKGMGGMEIHLITLCNALARQYQITVVAPSWMVGRFDASITVVPFDGLLKSRFNLMTIFKLRRLLTKLNPDLVHVHGSKPASLVTIPFLFRTFTRIATVHGIKKRIGLFRHFDHIIAVSAAVKKQILSDPRTRAASSKVTVILNGVVCRPGSVMCGPRAAIRVPPAVLAIGRLAPVKGFDVLIEAWTGVKEARLEIAGDGPDRESLEALIRKHNLQERVLLLGQRTDIPDLLAQSDLMVISSRQEGMPLVLAEALHAGCPVVSTAVGGMVGFLPESVLTHSEDPGALATRINEALSDLPGYSKHLESLYRFARTEMTVEAMARKTADVYEQVVESPC
jgi:glycosyltransferase involved in cell wall biosynthesis